MSKNEVQSSADRLSGCFALHFRHVAPFQNQSGSKVTSVANRGQILDFLTSSKIKRRVVKCPSQFFMHYLGPNHLYTFDGTPLDFLGG